MQIGKNSVVTINYTLKNDAGDVLDTSEGKQPLGYLHGAGGLLAGLEKALEGQEQGAALHVDLAPQDAYGVPNPSLVQTVPASAFGNNKVQAGMQFQAQGPQGTQVVRVTRIDGDKVTVDGNHPLAGQTLHFDVSVVNVRPGTPDEIAHGHVHGAGGHHH